FQESSSVEMSEGFENYWASRSSKWRNNLRRAQKSLSEKGKLEIVRYRPESFSFGGGDPNWDLYNACCDIAGKSWQHQSECGTTLTSPSVSEFLRESHEIASRLGMAEMLVARIDNKPIAFAYNYHLNGHVHGLRAGYDPEYAKDGIGAVLLHEAI